MQKRGNTYIPDGDEYFSQYFEGCDVFERDNLETGLKYVTEFECAIDGGAHVGSWTRELCKLFKTVYAFEPDAANYVCLNLNAPSAVKRFCALGDHWHNVGLEGGRNTGCWHVHGDGNILVMPLDTEKSLHNLKVGYIKLDVEGYEYFALKGARKLIERCLPVIQIEEKELPHRYECPTARSFLEGLGYREVDKCGRDVIFAHGS